MSESETPALGPSLTGTLVTPDLDHLLGAYVDCLSMSVIEQSVVSPELAGLWGAEAMLGKPYAILASPSGVPWVRIVEDKDAEPAKPFKQHGWMSLEVLVEDVDSLAMELDGSPFELYRPPADLDVSDNIRAMQVIGPAGEVLYLTQVKAAVPPFDIPIARCRVDQLFIPVMCCPDRDTALAFYRQFANGNDYLFDTKITSVNSAYGYELERKHPVATVQLAGSTMIEIDQIEGSQPRPSIAGSLPAGIAMISFEVDSLENLAIEWISAPVRLSAAPYDGRMAACCLGQGGERVELIERH